MNYPSHPLAAPIRRMRGLAYLVAFVGVAAFTPAIGERAWPTLVMLLAGAGLTCSAIRTDVLLAWDLVFALGLWWLFGPVSGSNFIPYLIVSLAPLLVHRTRARQLTAGALGVFAAEAALHAIAEYVELPLFHPPGPVPDAEFYVGLAVSAVILIGLAVLMGQIAAALRAGQEALETDLERQRDLHALKDRFLATASHQLRTPLTALRGFAALLADDELPLEARDEYARHVATQTEEMHTLVEDLLLFSRMEAGELQIRTETVPVADLIRRTVRGMGPAAEEVEFDLDPDVVVAADPPRLAQVIRNLVDNALKYGTKPVAVTARHDDGWMQISVIDAGPGLEPDAATDAFAPYVRLVSNTTMSEPGLGLGLTVASELARRHGGMLEYRGAEGGFVVRLPLASVSTPQSVTSSVSGR
ncbi:MAG: HAMP domain-containing sensor histidine kinase [Acidimicrobiia bacterium]|nr:HAMP domain-containing sensor histidine kinase [Acidimicrobiia bacterium]